MEKEAFIKVKETLGNYQNHSLEYTEFEDIAAYGIEKDSKELILISGYHTEAACKHYHWATDKPERIVEAVGEEHNCFLEFIPEEWLDTFIDAGYVIRDKFRDYMKDDLKDIDPVYAEAKFLGAEEKQQAAEVTRSCKGQSRGFTGQSAEWIEEWLIPEEEEGTILKAILIERNEKQEIIGLCCTGIYGVNSQKGPVAWIREVAVMPAYQNKGIARKLISQSLSYCKSHGAVRAFLAADDCNTYAIHLYKSLGFLPGADTQIDIMKE